MGIHKVTDASAELRNLEIQVARLERAYGELLVAREQAEQRIRTLIDFAPEAVVLLDVKSGRFLDVNPMAEQMFGMSRQELLEVGPFDLSPPLQPGGPSEQLGRALVDRAAAGDVPVFEWWHCNAQGERFPSEIRLVKIPWGDREVVRGTIVDISARKQIELTERGRSRVLESVARGAPLREVLATLTRTLEEFLPEMLCSVLLLDAESRRLHLGAAPSLPDAYNAAVEGLEIGPHVGSCGAAAYSGERVIVRDIREHPNWTGFREVAARAGLRACWSQPVCSLDGAVLGTFAMYYREPRAPVPVELRLIQTGAELAAIAIEHDAARRVLSDMNQTLECRVREQTRELTEANRQLRGVAQDRRLAAVAFETHDSILITDAAGRILRVNESFTAMTGYTPDEVLGKTPRVLKSGMHKHEFYERMWQEIRRQGHWNGVVWNRRKNGEVYPQQLTITAVKDESGRITHYVGDGRDVSDERRAAADRAAIDIARRVQEDLFPTQPPEVSGLDVAGAVFPAERVSGDYFDYLPRGENRVGLIVADVSGHGLGPALVMAQTQAYLRALAGDCDDPGEVLTGVNRLFHLRDSGRFVTLFLACLDMNSRSLHYAGAGHQGFLLDASGNLRVLPATGLPLGVMRDEIIPTSQRIAFEPGDILLLATDGYEETLGPDQQLFGRRGLDLLRAHRQLPAAELLQRLHTAARDFAQQVPQGDDVTLLIAKNQG